MSAPGKRTILVMAAGTGGHVFPGLAIAAELAARGWDVAWMGTPKGMENALVAKAGYPMTHVSMSGIRGKGLLSYVFLPLKILIAFWQATVAIFRVRPHVVLSMGGYVAFPGGMMAVLWGRPLVVHEPGAVAGITNRALALVADRVVVGLEGAFDRPIAHALARHLPKPARVENLGTPVRAEIEAVPSPEARLAGREGRLRLLVVGGSLGAQTMNDLVLATLKSMGAEERPEVVHQAGAKLHDALSTQYREAGVAAEVVPFIDDMAARYAWCDVLICRSGAVTVAEIGTAGIAAILFPLPWFVADEQKANANFLAAKDAGIALDQLATTPDSLATVLRGLTREKLRDTASRARALGRPGAAAHCADLCEELARAA
ncbi:undecaprenyldiphospho-muramoylpentapeptide beta-N-acetylglucosaminyltransferase [Usitatibacter palustris]|uniref:UDP-N-acetylglucosamine--N-acetylmuramyl-(pentapeptide) pyrophosphoryl-undecaprenol N-acetylglucosamine transferase n=1 Tax=Usitatibacter palustris TaxID=2732487 RepID=A0A6M4H5Q4_9PROT|nr:undecaprenyldiphospho-muramoylpentapeptide beta-N-acetylglucosaminyltransferase [Usitatibacter palustris]QJR13854.1 UDP-N-acetylglucosamine--N-acetylmuramyl-(pentapeptide) pyrophosphoryl-undecaprenol N-acetylglucosamine transferase [Usitatibacter palustris]